MAVNPLIKAYLQDQHEDKNDRDARKAFSTAMLTYVEQGLGMASDNSHYALIKLDPMTGQRKLDQEMMGAYLISHDKLDTKIRIQKTGAPVPPKRTLEQTQTYFVALQRTFREAATMRNDCLGCVPANMATDDKYLVKLETMKAFARDKDKAPLEKWMDLALFGRGALDEIPFVPLFTLLQRVHIYMREIGAEGWQKEGQTIHDAQRALHDDEAVLQDGESVGTTENTSQ